MTEQGRDGSAPEVVRRDAVAAADLRHELRTPVNQIIGFGELLIEEAEELGRADLLDGLRAIPAHGREVLDAIHRALTHCGEAGAGSVPPDLRLRLDALLGQIIDHCEAMRAAVGDSAPPELAGDLGKVQAAAGRLVDLVGRRLMVAGPDPGPPGA